MDPMSSTKSLLPLPLTGALFAAAIVAAAEAAVDDDDFALFAFFFSLQGPLCSGQAATWHAALQYATNAQPEHVLNVSPFFGLSPHQPHKKRSGSS